MNNQHSDYDYSIHYSSYHDEHNEAHTLGVVNYLEALIGPMLTDCERGEALDIGCATGFGLLALTRLGFRATGIDVDKGQIDVARRRKLDATLVSDSEEYLRQNTGRFDVITLMDVLEHIPIENQISFLRNTASALKPGGRLVMQVPNASSIIASRWRYIDFTHHTSFTEISVRFVLYNAGFTNLVFVIEVPSRWPPLKLWRRSGLVELRRWFIRTAWRQVLKAEAGGSYTNMKEMTLGPNLLCTADRK